MDRKTTASLYRVPMMTSLPSIQDWFSRPSVWLSQFGCPAAHVPLPSCAAGVALLASQTSTSACVRLNEVIAAKAKRRSRLRRKERLSKCFMRIINFKVGGFLGQKVGA